MLMYTQSNQHRNEGHSKEGRILVGVCCALVHQQKRLTHMWFTSDTKPQKNVPRSQFWVCVLCYLLFTQRLNWCRFDYNVHTHTHVQSVLRPSPQSAVAPREMPLSIAIAHTSKMLYESCERKNETYANITSNHHTFLMCIFTRLTRLTLYDNYAPMCWQYQDPDLLMMCVCFYYHMALPIKRWDKRTKTHTHTTSHKIASSRRTVNQKMKQSDKVQCGTQNPGDITLSFRLIVAAWPPPSVEMSVENMFVYTTNAYKWQS